MARKVRELVSRGIRRLGALLWAVAAVGLLASTSGSATAQQTNPASDVVGQRLTLSERPLATRAELTSELESLERRVASSPERSWVYQALRDASAERRQRLEQIDLGDPLRVRSENAEGSVDTLTIRRETVQDVRAIMHRMDAVSQRLETGDFRTGDLVELTVRNDEELTGKFPVNRERELELPTLPPVDLDGVLYSEVEPALREALGEYIRDPSVRARALWRVAVVGGVGSPGYYDLPPSATLSEAMMRAGGPGQRAKLDEIQFRRGGQDILEGRDRPVETLTLAELGAQRGDQLFVPQGSDRSPAMAILGAVSGLAGTAWAISRIF